ncbi:cytospin-A-like [Tachypleus tridentatus]|uniref:cytospin-A-like n=1 Tax=Tachypleus tridentatus TaxID=6853 RepID=UPI003FD595FC
MIMKNTRQSTTMTKVKTGLNYNSKGFVIPSSTGSHTSSCPNGSSRSLVERSTTTGSLLRNRKTSCTQKINNKTLSGIQENLAISHTKRKTSAPVKSFSWAVLGKGRTDPASVKTINKENIQTSSIDLSEDISSDRSISQHNMHRAVSKDSIDFSGNKECEKENLGVSQIPTRYPYSEDKLIFQEKEKRRLEQQISELVKNAEGKKAEIATLKMENKRLKEEHGDHDTQHLFQEVEALKTENRSLKERLVEMGAPLDQVTLSDSEKEQLLLRRSVSGSLTSLEVEYLKKETNTISPVPGVSVQDLEKTRRVNISDQESEPGEACGVTLPVERPLAEWDKMSCSSVSEISLSCLQDRIMQMEETQYSTSEELQATLQELADLQDQVSELHLENEQLRNEKAVLLESLCSQTEKLEECREQIEHLKHLLFEQYEDGTEATQKASDKERHMVEIPKNSQDQQEILILMKDELTTALQAAKEEAQEYQKQQEVLHDRVWLLSSTVESVKADKQLLDTQLAESLEQLSAKNIEINQLKLQLESEQQKVQELYREKNANATSELDALLKEARKDKERVEEKAMKLQEQLALSQRETEHFKEQLSHLQEETMVMKNNAKKEVSDLKYKIEQLEVEKVAVQKRLEYLDDALHQAELKCQHHLEDKRDLRANVSELQKSLSEVQNQLQDLKKNLDETEKKYNIETEEWKQFQDDLLTTVRVANDFKTEAQLEVERLESDNKFLKEKTEFLEAELKRLKVNQDIHSSPPQHKINSVRNIAVNNSLSGSDVSVVSSVERDLAAARRQLGSAKWQDYRSGPQLSVRTLIESIENAAKQVKGPGSSRSSSTSSLNSIASDSRLPPNSLVFGNTNDIFVKLFSCTASLRSVTSDATLLCGNKTNGHTSRLQRSSFSDGSPVIKPSGSPIIFTDSATNVLAKGLGDTESLKCVPNHPVSILATKLEPIRRNSSYSDLVEKKDPLSALVKGGGSKRNALLKWCQNKTMGYKGIDITNFSSSWNDGLAFCALLHTYLPDVIPYSELDNKDKKRNFTIAFKAAEDVGIPTTLNTNELISLERPDWQSIMTYVTSLYKHFET